MTATDIHSDLLKQFETRSLSADGAEALMRHISEQLHKNLSRYNWVGFYLMETSGNALTLGPYVGSFVPTVRIPLDKGLCGAAANSRATVVVNDVSKDPRYIGSDIVKSNIVAPILLHGNVVAELDIESYFTDTFGPSEQKFIEACAALVARSMAKIKLHNFCTS